jgi:integration host factor subunit beta
MNNKYNQIDLIDFVQSWSVDTHERTLHKIKTFFALIADELIKGNRIEFRGLGTFTLKQLPGYLGRNPKTGERIQIEPKRKISFKMSRLIKNTGKKISGEKND